MGKKLPPWGIAGAREQWQHVGRLSFGNYAALIIGLAIVAAIPGPGAPPEAVTAAAHSGSTTVRAAEPQLQPFAATASAGPRALPTATTDDPAEPAVAKPTPSPLIGSPPAMLEDGEQSDVSERPHLSSRAERERTQPTPLSTEDRFLAAAVAAAQASQRETGVPASVTLAQAILESNWGRSQLAQQAKNYFGIKANGVPGPAGVVYIATWEHLNGRDITVQAAFRAYNSMEESFADHGRYLRDKPIYAQAMRHKDDARQFARLIHAAGYATDPGYADKLIRLMDRYNLYQYDR